MDKDQIYTRNFVSMGMIKFKIHTPMFGIALILFLFSYISTPLIKIQNLSRLENLIIEIPPQHEEYQAAKSGRHYECKIKIRDQNKSFRISGIDYQYVHFESLYKDLKMGDTICIYAHNKDVYSLVKNNYDYCDLNAANNHRLKNKAWIRYIALIAAFFFGFGCLLENNEKVRNFYKRWINFSWGCLSVIIVIIAFFVVSIYIGTQNITNRFDYDKSYQEILKKYEYKTKNSR